MTRRKLLIAMTSIACTLSVSAAGYFPSVNAETYSFEMHYGEYLYYELVDEDDDGTYDYIEITDCDESATEVEIPEKIYGLPVTQIGDKAFYKCTSLASITIPDSVTSIGEYAFYDCNNLESVEIPGNVISIGRFAFEYCKSLESIEIPNSVTSIGSYAFKYCTSLTSIDVDENNEYYSSIDGVLFNKEKTVLICCPAAGKSGEYVIPDSVTSIGDSAFYCCISLESITIYASECEIYDSDYTIPGSAAICGYENSTAQTYAEQYDKTFIILGDANGDGKLTALDAAVIAKTLAQAGIIGETISVEDYPAMDYNGDGKITALDASSIARYLAEKALQN